MQMPTLGFIGLGSQGAPMARRMSDAGYPVLLWARKPEAVAPFADTTCEAVASVADVGARAEHVGICVVDDAGVNAICDELIPSMRRGSRIAIHSTVHPDTVIELGRKAAVRGIAVLDAPVSGGGPAAAAKTLTVMVGGDESVFADARPIFDTFGGLVARVGELGAGQMAKLVNNALMAAHVAIAHHGLAAGSALDLDRKALSEIIKVSSGRSFGFEVYARLPSPSAFAHGAKLLAKDMRLLGEALGGNSESHFAALREVVMPFLSIVTQDRSRE